MFSRFALTAALSVGGFSLVPRLADPLPLRGFAAAGARVEREWGDWGDVGDELRRIPGVVTQEAAHVSRVAERLGGR